MLGLKTTTLGFEILDINDVKIIVFLDTSVYADSPENPILQITTPASNRYYLAQIQPNKINVLSSNTFGLSNMFETDVAIDLPDGVYKFTYKICPYDYYCLTKYVLRTTILDRTIQNIYVQVDVTNCTKDDITAIKKELIDIHIFLESGKANALAGYPEKASKDYALATKKVNRLTDKLSI